MSDFNGQWSPKTVEAADRAVWWHTAGQELRSGATHFAGWALAFGVAAGLARRHADRLASRALEHQAADTARARTDERSSKTVTEVLTDVMTRGYDPSKTWPEDMLENGAQDPEHAKAPDELEADA